MTMLSDRSEMDDEYLWDLESIFPTDADWEDAYDIAESMIEDLRSLEGKTTSSGETLLAVLETYEQVMRQVSMVVAYARMRRDEDTRDDHYQGLTARSQSLVSMAKSAASYIEPELQELDSDEISALVAEAPVLETYDHFFDDVLRMKPHTRSAEVENILAELGEITGAPNEVYTMLTNADMAFPSVELADGGTVEITLSNFVKLQKRPDRDDRRAVYERFYDEWGSVRNTVSAAYRNSVMADVRLARIHNYETAREAALDGPKIPPAVYDNLVDTVRANLDGLHRHIELKRRSLGVDDIRMWDIYMPVGRSDSPEVPYERAMTYVIDSVEPLGPDYQTRLQRGLESRWVDVYENRGKQTGAYSGGTYDTKPFILMNYQDTIESMFTLAHELGHSLHAQLTNEHQPYIYSGSEIFVAEVASTVNETLLTHHLLDVVEDPTFRLHVLNEYLERFRSTLFRQTMFADFEHKTHEIVEGDGALTPDVLDTLYGELKTEFYEPAIVDPRIEREWMRIPHFYRAYYVFQYSTGISAAVALTTKILSEDDYAVERYLEFLTRGSRMYPLDLLDDAGVDMTSPQPVEDALGVYTAYLDEMDRLL